MTNMKYCYHGIGNLFQLIPGSGQFFIICSEIPDMPDIDVVLGQFRGQSFSVFFSANLHLHHCNNVKHCAYKYAGGRAYTLSSVDYILQVTQAGQTQVSPKYFSFLCTTIWTQIFDLFMGQ